MKAKEFIVGEYYRYTAKPVDMNGKGGWVGEMANLREGWHKCTYVKGNLIGFESLRNPLVYKDPSLFDMKTDDPMIGDKVWAWDSDPEDADQYFYVGKRDKSKWPYFVWDEKRKTTEIFNHVSLEKPVVEAEIELTVNGKPVTLSSETLNSIKEAIK